MALDSQTPFSLDDKEFDLLFSDAPGQLGSISVNPDKIQHFEHYVSEEAKPNAKCWELDYYKPFFNIDTETALLRLKKSVLSSEDFFSGGSPDLYCPFWIITTLIFIIGVSSNSGVLSSDQNWAPQISKVLSAATFLYTLASLVPVGCFCLLQHAGKSPKLVSILSLYAYSFSVFIPSLLICVLDSFMLRLCILTAATVWSLALLCRNFWSEVREIPNTHKWLVIGAIAGGHCLFSLVCLAHFLE
jgi:hypothetical protein